MVRAEDVIKLLAAVDEMLETVDTARVLSAKVPVRPTTPTTTKANRKSAAASGPTASPAVEERDEVVPPVVIKASPSTETAKSVLSTKSATSKSSAPVDGARGGDDEVRDKEEPVLTASRPTEEEVAATRSSKSVHSTKLDKSSVKAAPVDKEEPVLAASPRTEDEIAATRSNKSVTSTKLDKSSVEAAPVDAAGEPTAHSVNDNDDTKSVVSTKSHRSIKSFFSSKSTKKPRGVQLPVSAGNELTDDDSNKSVASNKSTRSIKSIASLLSFKSARSSKFVPSANDSAPVKTIKTVTSVDSTKSACSTKVPMSTNKSTSSKLVKPAIAKSGDSGKRLGKEGETTSPPSMSVAKATHQEKKRMAAPLPSLVEELPLGVTETVSVVEKIRSIAPVVASKDKEPESLVAILKDIEKLVSTYEGRLESKPKQNVTFPIEKVHPELDTSDLLDAKGVGTTTMEEKSCLPPTPIGTVRCKEEVPGESSVVAVGNAQEPPKEVSFAETSKEGEVVQTTPSLGSVGFTISESSSSETFDDFSNLTEDESMAGMIETMALLMLRLTRRCCGLFLCVEDRAKEAFHQADQLVGLENQVVAEGPQSMEQEQTTKKEESDGGKCERSEGAKVDESRRRSNE